jgi:hypothetical protein
MKQHVTILILAVCLWGCGSSNNPVGPSATATPTPVPVAGTLTVFNQSGSPLTVSVDGGAAVSIPASSTPCSGSSSTYISTMTGSHSVKVTITNAYNTCFNTGANAVSFLTITCNLPNPSNPGVHGVQVVCNGTTTVPGNPTVFNANTLSAF